MSAYPTSNCHGCGRKIVWAKKEDGNWIPLDPSAPVYEVTDLDENGQPIVVQKDTEEVMVAHFKTCPHTDRFGKRKESAE